MKTFIIRGLASILLVGAGNAAQAQQVEESLCTAPGLTVLTDNTGDVDADGLSPVSIPLAAADLVSLQTSLDDSGDKPMLTFTLKVNGSLAQLPPNFAWYTSFKSPGGQFYGVRMSTDLMMAVSFESYTLGESNGGQTDGRFPDVITPADASSNYSDDGTITLIVPASQVGVTRLGGVQLSQFNAGSVLSVGAEGVNVAAAVLDGMPDDLSRRGSLTLEPCIQTTKRAKLASTHFGGALGAGLLLPLLAFAGRRRRQPG